MKKQLRTVKMLERLNHHPLEKKEKDRLIVKRLLNAPFFRKTEKVLFYMPIHGEVDLSPLLETATGKKFILPRVNKEGLDMYYVKQASDLEKGSFKIPEPRKHLKKAVPSELELVLVPGIAFALNGHRIGYGKGFYDRLLKKVKCPKIGIAYEFQMVENIAAEEHDTPMDMIVTEKKTYHIKKP